MYKHILLATDLAETSHPCAQKARQLANQLNAKLSIMHVVEPIPAYGYPGVTAVESPYIEEAKKAIVKLGKDFDILPKDIHTEIGPTKFEILKIAEEIGADLIIVGSHGRHGLGLLLGSTANAVLHSAKCDVLTVHLIDQ